MSAAPAETRRKTHLGSDSSIHIHECSIRELLLDFLNLDIMESPTDETLQGADGVLEIRDFLRLGRFTKRTLFWAKGDEGSASIT